MKYVFEKDISIPLCAIKDNVFINYMNGNIIDNYSVVSFIKSGIKKKTLSVKQIKFNVYKVIDTKNNKLIAYNYELNGISNYVDLKDNGKNIRKHIVDKIMLGIYKQELIWRD